MRGQPFFHSLVFVLVLAASSAQAQHLTLDVLHTFTGADGMEPNPLARDAEGNLYGTTVQGGESGYGTVFEVDKNDHYKLLHSFVGSDDGAFPFAGVTRDAAGNLFSTTEGGEAGPGTIFKVDKNGHETVLYRFTNFADGILPNTAPILDAAGNLYGTTPEGGDSGCGFNGNGCGVVFELSAAGKFSVLHTFTSIETGMNPVGALVLDADGSLYGTTSEGGDLNCESESGCGTVFRIDSGGKFSILYQFTGKADGSYPGCVIAGSVGTLYGVTEGGGDLNCYPPLGCGTVFKMKTTGKMHKPDVLYTFAPVILNNQGHSCLVQDPSGNLYGTNSYGGAHNGGVLFEVNTSGKFADRFDFPYLESQSGSGPTGVLLAPNGDFYGPLDYGGDDSCGYENSGCGTVFRLRR
jgi:uncharacterized repeat protein (TIGR03803 family)